MISKENIKTKITQMNNFLLSIPIFYLGVGSSSLLWKLRSFFTSESFRRWSKDFEEMESLEEMERMW